MLGQNSRREAALGRCVLALAMAVVLSAASPSGARAPDDLSGDPLAEQAETERAGAKDILDLDIEQLGKVDVVVPSMDVEVSTVTRQESTVGRTPAAVFVITPEMIRRSGATSIPEVLRMAPGLDVARINSSHWAVSIRGFNGRFANKLLVQIDGRSIYTPVFGGVHWEGHHVMLEDIQRIEVIRGPGATVWGSNAVNGVINILTKKARDTQGLLVGGGAGNEERGFTNLRYGGKLADNFHWRVYGFQFDRDAGTSPEGFHTDDWRMAQGGFRADWEPGPCDKVTLQGDYFDGHEGATFTQQFPERPFGRDITEDIRVSGGNVLLRWSRDLGDDRGWAAQAYYDRFERHLSPSAHDLDTFDFDFQREFPLGDRHKLIWGFAYRNWKFRSRGSFAIAFDPPHRSVDMFSYFIQDQITLREDLLYLTVGSKFEHSDLAVFEYQPSARLLFAPDPRRALWVAISRAVRIPAISDQDMRLKTFNVPMDPFPPAYAQLAGRRGVESEDLMAYEAGYRAQPTDAFSWDLAAFFNKYEDLIVFAPGAMPGIFDPAPRIWPWTADNAMDGEAYGFELTGNYAVNERWRLSGSYSYLRMHLHADAGVASTVEVPEGTSPRNQVYFRSSWDLPRCLEFDVILRYVDDLYTSHGHVPSYVTMDARLAWRPSDCFEIALVAQNLLDDHHQEFVGNDTLATEVDRGAYGKVTWRY